VLDGSCVVFDGVNGVEAQSEDGVAPGDPVPRAAHLLHQQARQAGRRLQEGDRHDRLASRRARGPGRAAAHEGAGVLGVVDLVARTYLTFDDNDQGKTVVSSEIPADLADEAVLARAELCEAAAEHASDEILNRFFEAGDLGDDDLRAAIRASR
jgi:elongation factor G